MVFVQVLLRFLYVLELEVALGQARVGLHLLEFQRVLTLLLLSPLLLLDQLFLVRNIKLLQILLLELNTLLIFSLEVVELSDFVGEPGLAL